MTLVEIVGLVVLTSLMTWAMTYIFMLPDEETDSEDTQPQPVCLRCGLPCWRCVAPKVEQEK